MYNLRSRPGIHQTQQKLENYNEQYQETKLGNSKSSSLSRKEHHTGNDKESESDGSTENSEQYNKQSRIYPELPKEDDININDYRSKLKRQIINVKYPKLQEESNPFGAIIYSFLAVILLAILIALFFIFHQAGNNASCETPMCLFKDQYRSLRDSFTSQEKLSWKIIGSAIISVVNKTEHTQPAVILLVANKDSKLISSCIANYLASSIALSYGNSPDYPKIQNKQSDNSKNMTELIYTTFKESFGKENNHVIVMENLDTFSADVAMALHLFCDHENAPYKNIVIILTANADNFSIGKKFSSRDMNDIAQNHLNQVWKDELEEDKRSALLSRITASVAVIQTEKNVPHICYK